MSRTAREATKLVVAALVIGSAIAGLVTVVNMLIDKI